MRSTPRPESSISISVLRWGVSLCVRVRLLCPSHLCLGTPAGHGRWDAFLPKILHVIGTPAELASLRAASLNGGWELENDCRIGSVKHFTASQDPRAVSAVCRDSLCRQCCIPHNERVSWPCWAFSARLSPCPAVLGHLKLTFVGALCVWRFSGGVACQSRHLRSPKRR